MAYRYLLSLQYLRAPFSPRFEGSEKAQVGYAALNSAPGRSPVAISSQRTLHRALRRVRTRIPTARRTRPPPRVEQSSGLSRLRRYMSSNCTLVTSRREGNQGGGKPTRSETASKAKAAGTSGGSPGPIPLYTLTGAGCFTGTGVNQLKRSSAVPFTIP